MVEGVSLYLYRILYKYVVIDYNLLWSFYINFIRIPSLNVRVDKFDCFGFWEIQYRDILIAYPNNRFIFIVVIFHIITSIQ